MRRLGLVVAFVLVLAGCGAPAASPQRAVADAASRTPAARTSKVAFSVAGLPGLPEGSAFEGTGAVDFTTQRGTFRIKVPGVEGEAGTLDAVLDGPVLYQRFPQQLAELVPALRGRQWIRIDLAALSATATGVDVAGLAQASSADPSQSLAYLKGASSETSIVGRETLRGARVTRYRATLDLDRAAARAPAPTQDAIRKTAQLLSSRQVPADVWIDAAGRMRKMQYSVDFAQAGLGPMTGGASRRPGPQTFTFELWDFGAPVDVRIPPVHQTVDLAALLPAGTGAKSRGTR